MVLQYIGNATTNEQGMARLSYTLIGTGVITLYAELHDDNTISAYSEITIE